MSKLGLLFYKLRLLFYKLRLLFWRIAGDRIAGIALYLMGHGMHWRERHGWLNDHGPVQSFQRGMAILALVVGFAYAVTSRAEAASPLADLVDRMRWHGHYWHVWLWPHQWFGLLLLTSSVLLLAAIYEWPVKSEWSADNPATEEMTDHRLRSLLLMQLTGHMVALAYWGLTGSILLLSCHTSPGGWGSITFCLMHRHLYIRNNKEYEKERAEIRRWRISKAQAKAALKSLGAKWTGA